MARLIFIIASLTAIAVTLVHLRQREMQVNHEIQQIELSRQQLRRDVWDRQVRISELTSPDQVRFRAEGLALGLTARRLDPQTDKDVASSQQPQPQPQAQAQAQQPKRLKQPKQRD